MRTGTGVDAAIAVRTSGGASGNPVEVVVRIILNFVAHKMQTDNNEGKWKTMNMEAWIEWDSLFFADNNPDSDRSMLRS